MRLLEVLFPIWPWELSPQHNTAPQLVSAHACLAPAVMLTMLARPGTAVGLGEKASVAPWPSSPLKLLPQQLTVPSISRAQLKLPPAATALARKSPWVTGVDISPRRPMPSCPS